MTVSGEVQCWAEHPTDALAVVLPDSCFNEASSPSNSYTKFCIKHEHQSQFDRKRDNVDICVLNSLDCTHMCYVRQHVCRQRL